MKIITGMHRSGTSMVTNLVVAIKGQIEPDTKGILIPADIWNPNGYFENKDFVILNNRILLGKYAPSSMMYKYPPNERKPLLKFLSSFSNLNYFFVLAFPQIIKKRASSKAYQMRHLGEKHKDKIIKDPRFSLLAEFWHEVVSIKKVLFCFRHPYEVASSLQKRNRLPRFISYHLWKFHNVNFIKSAENMNVIFINYSNFFNPDTCMEEFKRLYRFLEMEFNYEEASELRDQIIEANLRHNNYADQKIPKSVERTYKELLLRHNLKS